MIEMQNFFGIVVKNSDNFSFWFTLQILKIEKYSAFQSSSFNPLIHISVEEWISEASRWIQSGSRPW